VHNSQVRRASSLVYNSVSFFIRGCTHPRQNEAFERKSVDWIARDRDRHRVIAHTPRRILILDPSRLCTFRHRAFRSLRVWHLPCDSVCRGEALWRRDGVHLASIVTNPSAKNDVLSVRGTWAIWLCSFTYELVDRKRVQAPSLLQPSVFAMPWSLQWDIDCRCSGNTEDNTRI
jgi:hypothetical protein